MEHSLQPHNTRIWWDGGEVEFIRWTEKALVFQWGDATETAIHMPRGAVMRLMHKGVLQIEGEVPEWIEPRNDLLVEPVKPEAPSKETQQREGRLSVIPRLIRKLAGTG